MSSNRKPASRGRRYGVVAAACLLAALTLIAGVTEGGAVGTQQEAKPQREAKRPNIVMIMTDDQAKSTMSPEVMPNLYTKLMAAGTSFSDYTVTTPLCCPSRAAYMTGQYGHNNGILRNFYPDLREKKNVLPTWLQRQGYSTAHVGKFLNGYEEGELGPAAVAPGWDLWFTQLERRKYYDWKASKNGEVVHYGTDDKDQATTVTSKFAVQWTERLVKKKDPFYLQADYYAPHTAPGRDTRCQAAPVPEAEDEGLYDGYPLPHPPSFNQADVSEMPTFIRDKPLLTGDEIAKITQHYRCALEALHGVDRGIGEIYDAVAAAGELNKTIFVFTSDNGYFYGEHRIIKGKPYPYAENINMPLTIRVPPRYRDQAPLIGSSDAPVANIDLAPTLLELAGGKPCRGPGHCRVMDGRSLMPLIEGTGEFPSTRGIGLERYSCDFRGVRWGGSIYVSYSLEDTVGCQPAEAEMYDLAGDPYQLNDQLPTTEGTPNDALRVKLARKMRRLGDCAGIRGRDPKPASGHYCE